MKIAIIHEWLVNYAGSERVLEQIINVYPDADLFSLIDFLPDHQRGFIKNKNVKTSFIQNLPKAKNKYRNYLPIMPIAVEQFDLSSYDLIISSSHAVAKGVLTGPDQLHICMCYSPIRYAWDLQHQYLNESNLTKGFKSILARMILHYIRLWDYRTANGVDDFISISKFISRRVKKYYGRDSKVIYPPVDVSAFVLCEKKENFYLTVSRMVPYKKIDLIVEAFKKMPDKKLVVIGEGTEFDKINSKKTNNITIMGFQLFEVIKDFMQRAKAFVFAAEEDFGIAPLEAQACGTPVIAYGKGGSLETIIGLENDIQTNDKPTGIFFYQQNIDSIIEAINKFESLDKNILPIDCRNNAMRFSPERFQKELREYVFEQVNKFKQGV